MGTIVGYVRDYFRAEWNAKYFLSVAFFLAAAFAVNYGFGFETAVLRSVQHPFSQAAFYALFYAVPFLLTMLLYVWSTGRSSLLMQKRFWVTFVAGFAVLPVYITLHNVPWFVYNTSPGVYTHVPVDLRVYFVRYLSNLLPGVLMFVPLVVFWRRYDRNAMNLYGFSSSNINLGTYVAILAILIPVVIAASWGADFRAAYPRYKFGLPQESGGMEKLILVSLFQLCYGVDFVFVEFVFRGFMVLAFSRVLGSASILPMVVVYALIHFQKPLGEALASILGGMVLGIISYRTKSIYGGVILHLGVASTMEIAGTIQMMLRGVPF